jgi:molybdopterin-guanine dinucleotide biosynthesis protein B
MRVFGIAGFRNAGKTTLVVELVEALTGLGLAVATLKHAHHAFDVDQPGKDSYRHREAGAEEVLIVSARRLAHVVELGDRPEPGLGELLGRLGDVDLVLAEGFKRGPHPKLQLVRDPADPLLACEDPTVRAVVSDLALPRCPVPVLPRSDLAAIIGLVLTEAVPAEALVG